jgi:CheY-like chemotaxis protein
MIATTSTSVASPRILIVDDNPAIHRDFEKVLNGNQRNADLDNLERDLFGPAPSTARKRAYALDFAKNGHEAAVLAQRAVQEGKPYTMAFVDMRMPGLDGIEVVTHLFQIQPNLQVAICSAYMDYSWQEVLQRVQRPGLRLLRKPWMGAEVMAIVHELCTRAQSPAVKPVEVAATNSRPRR